MKPKDYKNILTAFRLQRKAPPAIVRLFLVLVLVGLLYGWSLFNRVGQVVSGANQSFVQGQELNTPVFEVYPKLRAEYEQSTELQNLTARAYLVYDVDSQKILISENNGLPLPIASLTKLSVAVLTSRELAPDEIVEIPAEAIADLPTPKLGLVPGEKITVSALVEAMLVASANDAAEVLAWKLGQGEKNQAVVKLNLLAQELGLKQTQYANFTGLDQAGAYSTADDLLTIIFELQRSPWLLTLLSESRGRVTSADGVYVHRFQSTNSLLTNKIVTGGKTGFTDDARGNLAVFALSPSNSRLVAVLLGSESREEEMSTILNWVNKAHSWK